MSRREAWDKDRTDRLDQRLRTANLTDEEYREAQEHPMGIIPGMQRVMRKRQKETKA